MFELGNTRDICHSRKGDHRSVVQLSDRDHGGRFNTWAWQDMKGTLRQVELMREIERDGPVYLGSIPLVHYDEMQRFRRLEKMDTPAWQAFIRAYLCHRDFRKFQGTPGFAAWSPWSFFFDLLQDPKALTAFWDERRKLVA